MDIAFGIYFITAGLGMLLLSANLWEHARWRMDQIMSVTAAVMGVGVFAFGIAVVS